MSNKDTSQHVLVETDDGIVEFPLGSTATNTTETSKSVLVETDGGIVEFPLS
ncbi:hypothetical protein NE236_35140 [Actinoallomurus purpureus]|uniref:hypothetical protein n=1 Tax=Actinoallomurus purpureus TaxID=478114 RepID=UPI002093E5AF|nr:hypothetical protein [Actinoallomurus purpureus]MCO6010212.1 hypothetical protein [Actinoallomurus purpureus]